MAKEWEQQVFAPGDRVVVREGYTGTVLAVAHDGIYYVMLDDGQGEGPWRENELTRTAVRSTLADAGLAARRIASEDYPELSQILTERPDYDEIVDPDHHMAERMARTASLEPKEAFYFPMEQTPEAVDKQKAYQDGWDAAVNGGFPNAVTDDPRYRAEFLMGWADGVKAAHAPDEPQQTWDLATKGPSIPEMHFTPIPQGWVTQFQAYASLTDFLLGRPDDDPGRFPSVDACRFRRDSHCWFPSELDRAASNIAGYAVWVPKDRGFCQRVSWDAQRACPVFQPGPNEPGGFTDATIPWSEGGQRGGYVGDRIAARVEDDDEWGFHYTAAWVDVRRKATEIRRSGGVRILSTIMYDELHPESVAGQVNGANNVYDTRLVFVPGTYQIAYWECTCKWARYSWGRTGPWKKFEGRMCSHALAMTYEVQGRGMTGLEIYEDPDAPAWVERAASNSGQWPAVEAMLRTGASVAQVHHFLVQAGLEEKTSVKGRLKGQIDGRVVDLEFDDGRVFYQDMPYDGPVLYPAWDPSLGLRVSHKEDDMAIRDDWALTFASEGVLKEEPEAALPYTEGEEDISDPTDPREPEQPGVSAKTASTATWSRAEQEEIINEGMEVEAGNLDQLRLEGTHYLALEERQRQDEPDDGWLW